MAKQFDVKVKGLDDFTRAIHAQAERIDKAAEMIVRKGSTIVERNAKMVFLGSPTKKQTGRGRLAQGLPAMNGKSQSFPTPTSRSGNLRDSIGLREAKRIGPGRWMSSTGPSVVYGKRVEEGGVSQHNMAWGRKMPYSWNIRTRAFPYMEPGLQRSMYALEVLYREEWRKALA